MEIGKQIKDLRIQKGMTQEDLADKTEVSVRTIQRIENGAVDPRKHTLQMIAKALGVNYDMFIEPDSDEKQKIQQVVANNWIALLYLSGIIPLIFPTFLIWNRKKHTIKGISDHYRAAIGLQIKVLGVILACLWILWKVHISIPIIGVFMVNMLICILIVVKIMTSDPSEPISVIEFGKKKEKTKRS